DGDVVLTPTADRQLRGVEVEVGALVDVGALHDHEPAGLRVGPRRGHGTACGARGEDEALLGQPQIAARSAHDAPDDEVEDNEERDLQDKQDLIDRNGVRNHSVSRPKVTSVEPIVIVSPSWSFARLTRLPLTSIPLVEPR